MQKSFHSGAGRTFRPGHKRSGGNSYGGGRSGGNRGGGRGPAPKNIHPSKFINKAVEIAEEAPYEPTHTFADFAINAKTKQNIEKMGYVNPSPIQDQCIPLALEGKDIIGLANTGTGKTAAFLLPMIEKLGYTNAPIEAIILAPTRELAQQIDQEFRRFSEGQKLFSALVVGGANIGKQISQIRRAPHIVVGTPGRVKDLIDRGVLVLNETSILVLDEADRMCDMGFSKDIRYIAAQLPTERQTLCFSATMTNDVKIIVQEFMQDPVTISVVKNQTNDHIEQDIIHANDKNHKLEILAELLKDEEFKKVVVFGETKFGVQRLSDALNGEGLSTAAIHGNKSQSQRERALRSFKNGEVNVLIATDVAARGLDVPNVTHVINFDQPQTYDDYVHRIGRTGRAGKAGKALTFVSGHRS